MLADATVLKIMNNFDFWSAVPLDGSASYDEIAKRTNLPVDAVRRVLVSAPTLPILPPIIHGSIRPASPRPNSSP